MNVVDVNEVCSALLLTRCEAHEVPGGEGIVEKFRETLPDYGCGSRVLDFHEAASTCERGIVEFLNDVRLRDQVLIVTGLKPQRRDSPLWAVDRVLRYNIATCFLRQGGRAIVVSD